MVIVIVWHFGLSKYGWKYVYACEGSSEDIMFRLTIRIPLFLLSPLPATPSMLEINKNLCGLIGDLR